MSPTVGQQEHLLQNVFGLRAIADNAQEHAQQERPVSVEERGDIDDGGPRV